MTTRTVLKTIPSQRVMEGGGVQVWRTFPAAGLDQIDPFLLLDEMGPLDIAPGQATGFPDHPHRGFQTVTYMLEGSIEHRDSFGHRGLIGPGDIQWMTAGSGLVHSEMPGTELIRQGGRLHGFQLWVNLPQADKMMAPSYQELPASAIPVAERNGVKVRNISGAVETRTPITYLHLTLASGASYVHEAPRSQNALVYQFSGRKAATFFANDGDQVRLDNPGDQPLEALLLTGEPLREPVARHGPFVMNTRAEIEQAFADYRAGRMGTIIAESRTF